MTTKAQALVQALVAADGNVPLVAEAFSATQPDVIDAVLGDMETFNAAVRARLTLQIFEILSSLRDHFVASIEGLEPYEAGRVYTQLANAASILVASPKAGSGTVINNVVIQRNTPPLDAAGMGGVGRDVGVGVGVYPN